jgi:uncharacterized protein YkwD
MALVGTFVAGALAISLLLAGSADASMVAPRSKCDGQTNIKAPESVQEDAMRCLINFARKHAGSGGLGSDRALERAAGRKVGDLMDCGFSHTACGNPFDLYAHRFGYASGSGWQVGENLAWGRGKRGSARNILQAWLNSPPHRETMLRGSFDDLGLGLRRGGFNGSNDAGVWVLEVGCHGC